MVGCSTILCCKKAMATAAAKLDDCQDSDEYIIYDVLDEIFRHLSIKSLRNVALVSRSWNHAAKREIAKRGAVFRVLLPVLHNEGEGSAGFDADDYFVAKPDTLLMFCGPKSNWRPVLSLEYKIMEKYHERLPGRMVMLGVDHAMMDTKEVLSCTMQQLRQIETPSTCDKILGLCLPESKDFTIKVAECVSHEQSTEQKARTIFGKLHDEEELLENPIFLLFSRNDYSIGSHVLRMFREKYAGKRVNVWGSTIGDFIKRSDDGYPDYRGTHGFLGILLQGPRLSAHCLILAIDCEDSMSRRLTEFHCTFKLKRCCVGLICGPCRAERRRVNAASEKYYHPVDFMKIIKHEFPTIDFAGMFNDQDFHYYGCDHTTGDYSLEHKGALSIMILTYD